MSPRHPAREALINGLYQGLRGSDWSVEREPWIGSRRPDLLARDRSGHTFLLEVKVGPGASHFGSLAQVASFVRELQTTSGEQAVGVLVTDQSLEPKIAEAAQNLGIRVVSVGADEPLSVAAASIAGELGVLAEG